MKHVEALQMLTYIKPERGLPRQQILLALGANDLRLILTDMA